MPQTGYCTDQTCKKELTQLYECHCCNSFVCLNHLLEHIEISKQTTERLDKLRNELTSASSTLQTIVEKKIHEIEREKQLINQATAMFDMRVYSIDQIQNVYQAIILTILSNGKEEPVVKDEPPLSAVKICACNRENDTRRILMPNNSLQQAESPMINDTTNLVDDSQIIDLAMNDVNDEKQNQIELSHPKILVERCSLVFDEVIDHTKVSRRTSLRSTSQTFDRRLSYSLKKTREGKQIHTRSSLQPASNDQHLQTRKLFDKSDEIIHCDRRVPCPLSANLINLFGYDNNSLEKKSCRYRLLMRPSIIKHLKKYHDIPAKEARRIFDAYKRYCTEMISPLNNNSHSYRSIV